MKFPSGSHPLVAVAAVAIAAVPLTALAQAAPPAANSAPQALPLPPAVPVARDVPYPGTIALAIDATDVARGIFRVDETIPVSGDAREIVLLLPSWLPGNHSPAGSINLLGDVHFQVDGKDVPWTRDTVAVNAFRVSLPAGASAVTARFVQTAPVEKSQGRITMTQDMLNLQWDAMSLYPAGYYVRGIKVQPTVTFPAGWRVFTALDGQSAQSGKVTWSPVAYDTLVDSPVFAGRYARRFEVAPGVSLDAVADHPDSLDLSPEHLKTYTRLVSEAETVFGSRHFDHYDWLLALTDELGGIGLEHHRSSENSMIPDSFTDWDGADWQRNVLAHEFTHSWNGKFRRPAGLWTPDYQEPMRDSLLWVYEGQTQFWGNVLAARSGVQSKQAILDSFANIAALYSEGQPGRAWRSVEDTTNDPIINSRRPLPSSSLSRSEDYYNEGALVWLEADQIIRQKTGGKKGLDDFAKAFFGVRNGDWGEVTYTFDDIVSTLNAVVPYDWATFLRTRLYEPGQPAPTKGIEMAGYKLVWKDKPNAYTKARSAKYKQFDLTYSIGAAISKDGTVASSVWNGPAFNAGLVGGVKIIAVDGTAYDEDALKQAIVSAKDGKDPIRMTIQRGTKVMETTIDYHGGLRYPWLESTTPGKTNGFDRLLTARTR